MEVGRTQRDKQCTHCVPFVSCAGEVECSSCATPSRSGMVLGGVDWVGAERLNRGGLCLLETTGAV